MPVYEYKCPRCKQVAEIVCAIRDRDLPLECENYDCDEYRQPVMKRIMSPTHGVVKNPAVPKRSR
jgi:predicted nucleic acid-binding Zn ribbon protein